MRVSLPWILALFTIMLAGCLTEPADVGGSGQGRAVTGLSTTSSEQLPGTVGVQLQAPDIRPPDFARHSIVRVFPIYEATEEIEPGIFRWDLFGFEEKIWLLHEGSEVHDVAMHGTLALGWPTHVSTGPFHEEVPWIVGDSGWEVIDFPHRYDYPLCFLNCDVTHFEDGEAVCQIHRRYSGPIFAPSRPTVVQSGDDLLPFDMGLPATSSDAPWMTVER